MSATKIRDSLLAAVLCLAWSPLALGQGAETENEPPPSMDGEATEQQGQPPSPFGPEEPQAPVPQEPGEDPPPQPEAQPLEQPAEQAQVEAAEQPQTLHPAAEPQPHQVVEDEPEPPGPLAQDVRLVAVPPPPQRPWHIGVAADAGAFFVRNQSLDPLNERNSVVVYSVRVEGEYNVMEDLPLTVQIGYGGTGFSEHVFLSTQTRTRMHSLEIGLAAGYRFWGWFTPFIRAGATFSWTELTLEGTDTNIESWAFAPGAYGMAGLELSVARRAMARAFRTQNFTLGVRLEGGYIFSGSFAFESASESSSLVEHETASLGTLKLRGAAFRVGAFFSF